MVKRLHASVVFAAASLASAANVHLSQGSGATVAISQRGVDYTKDTALPLVVDFLSNYPLPNPLVSGKSSSIEYKVEDVKLSNIGMTAEVKFVAPNKLSAHVNIKSLEAFARVHGRETVWPHPKATAHAHAKTTNSNADVVLTLNVDSSKQMPSIGIQSCKTHISMDISVSGLSILNPIADLIVKQFRSKLESTIGKALCDAATEGVGDLSKIITDFSYQQSLGSRLNNAIIDFHLTSSPTVVNGPPLHLQTPMGAEFITKDAKHAPITAPALPVLTSSDMGSHMATVQLSPWPVNTALWTAQQEGLMQYDVHKNDLGSVSMLLTTDYWANLLPQMADRFNTSTDMLIRVMPADPPILSLANKSIGITGTMALAFVALSPEGEVPAFVFSSPVLAHGEVHLSDDLTSITGSIIDIDTVDFSVASSNFGDLSPSVCALVNPLLNTVVQQTAIPKANEFFAIGYDIPFIKTPVGSIAFANPKIELSNGYALVGSDLVFDLGTSTELERSILV